MTRTYIYGYNNERKTLAEMETRSGWNHVHPEMRQRLIAMFEASQDAGHEVGFGEGWRSSAAQQQVFLERHTQVASGGCCGWDGKRWQLKSGLAHAAPPGRSYHEETDGYGNCFAADLVGDLRWMNANCHTFGLIHFANVNSEPWHTQPYELPTSRRLYTGQNLETFKLPGWTTPPPVEPEVPPTPFPGGNNMDHLIEFVSCPTSTNPAIYLRWQGGYKTWMPNPAAFNKAKDMAKAAGKSAKTVNYDADSFRALGPIFGPRPARVDDWGV